MTLSQPASGKSSKPGPPRGSCVVDEKVKLLLSTLHLRAQPLDLVQARQVGRNRDALPDARQLPGQGVARVRLARGDVGLGAILDVTSGDHLADAAASAGDERDLAAHTEQLLDLHRAPPCFMDLHAGSLPIKADWLGVQNSA
jgi:hypothetical protein